MCILFRKIPRQMMLANKVIINSLIKISYFNQDVNKISNSLDCFTTIAMDGDTTLTWEELPCGIRKEERRPHLKFLSILKTTFITQH